MHRAEQFFLRMNKPEKISLHEDMSRLCLHSVVETQTYLFYSVVRYSAGTGSAERMRIESSATFSLHIVLNLVQFTAVLNNLFYSDDCDDDEL